MSNTTLQIGCKINLSLHITAIRPNGYHELDSLFYPLPTPFDRLHLSPSTQEGLTCTCDTEGIDLNSNTLTKAYTRYAERTGFCPPLALHLEKGIPHGAGLGGGSADAAALLVYLNSHNPTALAQSTLIDIATSVGADVPFFLQSAPCHVEGIGEKLTPLPFFLTGWHIVLLCPAEHVSTMWAYQAWDRANLTKLPTQGLTSSALKAKEFVFQHSSITNTFEGVVFEQYSQLRVHKEDLLKSGANAAVLSGSGSSIVGLFRDAKAAHKSAQSFHSQGLKVYSLAL